MKLEDFSLIKESDDSYTIGHPKGKSMMVPKKGMSDTAQLLISKLKKVQNLDEGGTVQDATPDNTIQYDTLIPQEQADNAPYGAPPVGAPSSQGQAVPEVSTPVQINENNPAQQSEVPASTPSPQSTPASPASYAQDLQTAKGSIEAGTAAEAREGLTNAKTLADTNTAIQKVQDDYQERFKASQVKQSAFEQQLMNGKIDPDRYTHNMDTGSRISASIGMILSGLGSAVTGGPNLAMQQLNKTIDNDILAQQNDQSKTMNLWKMNREAMGDDSQATLATQNQMLGIAKTKMLQAAASAQGDIAKARAASAILGIDQQVQQNNMRTSLMEADKHGSQFSQIDPAVLVPRLVPPEHQAKAFGEIAAAENTRRMAAQINTSFEEAVKENTALKTGAGLLRTPGSVYALHQAMQPTFADLEGTVRQAAMDNTFKNITPAPGDSEYTISQKRASKDEYLKSKMSAPISKAYGIDLQKFQSSSSKPEANFTPQQQSWVSFARANPNDPRSALVLKKLGIQ